MPGMIREYDVPVPMRDGVNLTVDIYRPDAPGKYPVLYACAMHNKDLQRVEVAENLKVGQPAWSTQWYGIIEAGDSKRLVANGYVHVIGLRASGTPWAIERWTSQELIDLSGRRPGALVALGSTAIRRAGRLGRSTQGVRVP